MAFSLLYYYVFTPNSEFYQRSFYLFQAVLFWKDDYTLLIAESSEPLFSQAFFYSLQKFFTENPSYDYRTLRNSYSFSLYLYFSSQVFSPEIITKVHVDLTLSTLLIFQISNSLSFSKVSAFILKMMS